KRVEFERWRQQASEAYANHELVRAREAVDTAAVLFPGHQWCAEMTRLIAESEQADRRVATESTRRAESRPTRAALSDELRREVDQANREAQKAFEEGDLTTAIEKWETVERMAPDYLTVRKYLVNAYKFVGVEQYGQGSLTEAINTWRKAALLDPGNQEIREYIRRTENEILKLRELSYEQ
ncbi:MAG: hypothetical protein KKA42_16525, partial [candidate division Zixibacteria bacterium]|nr:hypothetical protein [candidate division Zixibacteria bacterium]